MKKQVSLSEVLTGKPVVKSRSKAQKLKSTKNVDLQKKKPEVEEKFRSRQIEPAVNDGVEQVSLKDFLMSKQKEKDKPVVISLDDDPIMIDDGPITMNAKVMEPEVYKKTSLKGLFENFEKKPSKKSSSNQPIDDSDIDRKPYDGYGSIERLNAVSKLKELPLEPFPKLQLIYDNEDMIKNKPLISPFLTKKDTENRRLTFSSTDYLNINGVIRDSDQYICKVPTTEINDDDDDELKENNPKHISLWTELLSPKTPREVLLEPQLKDNVFKWISDAFQKLKRPTTRHKLMKQTKQDKMRNELEDFIVPDNMIFGDDEDDIGRNEKKEEEFVGEIEFVPLMILHGEGIGKNTLIKTISNSLNCQIYEINSAANRGKKEILDILLEFSTTHYVKGVKDGIILIDDVDVIFHEHDKFLWQALEKVLMVSRRPVILTCRDINYIPTYLIDVAEEEQSIFAARKVSKTTVKTLLTRYMETLRVKLTDSQTDSLLSIHGGDIRGCLMDFQFYNNEIRETFKTDSDSNKTSSSTLDTKIEQTELYSFADMISNAISTHSSFKEDIDSTLMTRRAMEYVKRQSDDQLKLKHDYMVDYQLHLIDQLYNPVQPFELDVGKHLIVSNLSSSPAKKKAKKTKKHRIDKVVDISASYLSSRVDPRNNGNDRSSRNSRRRIREVLERLDSNYETFTESEQQIRMDLDLHKYTTFAQEINPYIVEMAKHDNDVKQFNRQLFEAETVGLSKDEMNAVVYRLTEEGLLKPIFFKANPREVLDCWK